MLVLGGAAHGGAFAGHDGLLAFARTTADGQATLVTLDPATGAEHVLGPAAEPAWSPDGSRLAYVRGGDVYVAAANGGGETLVGRGEDPAWSPDGTKLVVSRSDGQARQLVVLGLADGSATLLTHGQADARLPAWSPDGTTIAFATAAGLATIPATGGPIVPLPLPGPTLGGPSWSPDGRVLAFLDPGGQVWTAAPDGKGARQLTYTLTGASGADVRPAWAPDGGLIAFAAGADLCVADLAGNVSRLTRTPQTSASVVASLPDWQPAAVGSGPIVAPPAAAGDSVGCDWNPGARVEVLPVNVLPSIVSVAAPQEVAFVNHLTQAVTVTTTMHDARATIEPGRFFAFATEPGEYDFTVAGYPDGVPRRGSIVVAAAGSVSLEPHAPIRYGSRTVLAGDATGPPGSTVTITAQAYGSARPAQLASSTPAHGHWQVSVAPAVTTRYRVTFAGATAERLLRVMPVLKLRRARGTLGATLAPAARLAGRRLYLFRSAGRGWSQVRTARVGPSGAARFGPLPPGRYYVGFVGGDDYWSTASEPFTVRR